MDSGAINEVGAQGSLRFVMRKDDKFSFIYIEFEASKKHYPAGSCSYESGVQMRDLDLKNKWGIPDPTILLLLVMIIALRVDKIIQDMKKEEDEELG